MGKKHQEISALLARSVYDCLKDIGCPKAAKLLKKELKNISPKHSADHLKLIKLLRKIDEELANNSSLVKTINDTTSSSANQRDTVSLSIKPVRTKPLPLDRIQSNSRKSSSKEQRSRMYEIVKDQSEKLAKDMLSKQGKEFVKSKNKKKHMKMFSGDVLADKVSTDAVEAPVDDYNNSAHARKKNADRSLQTKRKLAEEEIFTLSGLDTAPTTFTGQLRGYGSVFPIDGIIDTNFDGLSLLEKKMAFLMLPFEVVCSIVQGMLLNHVRNFSAIERFIMDFLINKGDLFPFRTDPVYLDVNNTE